MPKPLARYISALLLLLTFASKVPAQSPIESNLQQQIRTIAADAHGKVSVACSLPSSSLNCDLDPTAHPPMQSVFKLPLALTVLDHVDQGTLALDQPVRFLPEDRILPHVYSPLQDKYPAAGVDVPLQELLRLSVSLSDNVAADILLRLLGGPQAVDAYIASLGITGFHLQDGEATLHREMPAQYRNWFEPAAAVQLLRRIADNSPLTPKNNDLLLNWMHSSTRTRRIERDLPEGTFVAHKSGTSDVDNGLAHATNDIGLITLPDGRRLAIAVFVTDSTADEATREKVIARISRAAYDAGTRTRQSPSPPARSLPLTPLFSDPSKRRRAGPHPNQPPRPFLRMVQFVGENDTRNVTKSNPKRIRRSGHQRSNQPDDSLNELILNILL